MSWRSINSDAGKVEKDNRVLIGNVQGVATVPSSQAQLEESERKSRVDAAWEKMNVGVSVKAPLSFTNKSSSTVKKTAQKTSHKTPPNWMTALGMSPKKTVFPGKGISQEKSSVLHNGTSDEAKRIAAAALSAVKDAAAAAAAAASGRGKVEITEVRDFAGEEIEVKKLVDIDSEAAEKAKAPVGQSSAVDSVLEQIKKKPKLSVLDKTKKDWGEFKEENRGLEDELDKYKKSSNQYLDKMSFLQRTDYREFERERDARLSLQAKRRPDMREEP